MIGMLLLVGSVLSDPVLTPNLLAAPLTQEQQWALVRATARVSVGENTPPFGTAVCVAVTRDAVYLLTAGHVLTKGQARVFEFYNEKTYPKPAMTIVGAELVLDLPECDTVLLKCLPAEGTTLMTRIPLASWESRPRKFPQGAMALGCPSGTAPIFRSDRIMARRYVKSKDNYGGFFWETENTPIGGMSGGPLLDLEGRLIGICTANQNGKGYFSHLDEILAGLKRNGFGWVAE